MKDVSTILPDPAGPESHSELGHDAYQFPENKPERLAGRAQKSRTTITN